LAVDGAHATAVDLVLEAVLEEGGVEAVARRAVEVGRDLTVHAGLGRELRRAHHRAGALAAEAGDAREQLAGLGRLVARAHAALEGPRGALFPHTVDARAGLA